MNTNALAALEQIRQTCGLHHRASPHEIVQEVKRRIIPVPRPTAPARVLPESDDLDIRPRRIPLPREMVEKARVETLPAPRAPIILPSLTKAPVKSLADFNPVDRIAIIRAAAKKTIP